MAVLERVHRGVDRLVCVEGLFSVSLFFPVCGLASAYSGSLVRTRLKKLPRVAQLTAAINCDKFSRLSNAVRFTLKSLSHRAPREAIARELS